MAEELKKDDDTKHDRPKETNEQREARYKRREDEMRERREMREHIRDQEKRENKVGDNPKLD